MADFDSIEPQPSVDVLQDLLAKRLKDEGVSDASGVALKVVHDLKDHRPLVFNVLGAEPTGLSFCADTQSLATISHRASCKSSHQVLFIVDERKD